ncbi:hypothetical protein BGZ65_004086 [Modicella reniformis]|uniref:Uncharacterized protein n=1 Tax=Modicella reniformis TaxID=1440133 RepID=A0A9P6STG3_9FUNG|nr:hypothetical protein BGZ65_004086 [Modicella reniformis]
METIAPLLQVVYNGTFMRLTIKTHGMFIIDEIGAFEVPIKVAVIPALGVTLPTLLAARDDIQRIWDGDMNALKRSLGMGTSAMQRSGSCPCRSRKDLAIVLSKEEINVVGENMEFLP